MNFTELLNAMCEELPELPKKEVKRLLLSSLNRAHVFEYVLDQIQDEIRNGSEF